MRRTIIVLGVLACSRGSVPSPDAGPPSPAPVEQGNDAPRCSVECLPTQTCCSGVCVDLRGNPDNCGACGRGCQGWSLRTPLVCADGQCVTSTSKTCPKGMRGAAHGNLASVCCPETDKCSCAPGCPISRRSAKTNITYLLPDDEARLLDRVRALRLATYAYRPPFDDGREHLGYVLDDAPDLPSSAGDVVDLYAYASVVLAAVKEQQREIDALEARLAALERR